MADKTTGERKPVKINSLPFAADIYDDLILPGEFQGGAVKVAGAQIKDYAQAATMAYVGTAVEAAKNAEKSARTATEAAAKVSTEVVKEASEKMQGWMDTAEKAAKSAVEAETGAEGAAKAAGDCVTQAKASENKAKEYADTAKEYANQTAGNVPAVTVGWDADGYFSWFENKEDV